MQSTSRLSVLLIEPNADNREMYAASLAYSGFDVVAAANSTEALAHVPAADVVVTGIHVGAVDGPELIRRLRQQKGSSHKALLILTAWAHPADRERAEAAGCDAFLLKPCLPQTLVTEIVRTVALRSIRSRRPLRAGLATAHSEVA